MWDPGATLRPDPSLLGRTFFSPGQSGTACQWLMRRCRPGACGAWGRARPSSPVSRDPGVEERVVEMCVHHAIQLPHALGEFSESFRRYDGDRSGGEAKPQVTAGKRFFSFFGCRALMLSLISTACPSSPGTQPPKHERGSAIRAGKAISAWCAARRLGPWTWIPMPPDKQTGRPGAAPEAPRRRPSAQRRR